MSDEKYVGAIAAAKNVALTKAALANKADKVNATASAAGLMSAADKTKLDGIAEGANKTVVDSALSVSSTNPVQNKVVKVALDDKADKTVYYDVYVQLADTQLEDAGVESGCYVIDCTASHTYAEIKAAADTGQTPRAIIVDDVTNPGTDGITCPLLSASETAYNFEAPNNVGVGGTGHVIIGHITTDYAWYACSAGELPAVKSADNGKYLGVSGGAYQLMTTPVDGELSDTSENPVQNKAVKAALDNKLDKGGGDVSGSLSLTGGITVGFTKADTGVHLYKDSEGVAKLTSGSADVDDNITMARLKIATPTEDDDAVTKAYVDGKACVRYDEAQTLTQQQKLQARKNIGALASEAPTITGGWMSFCPNGSTDSNDAVHVTVTKADSENYTAALDGGPENWPVYVGGVATPTDAQTNYAANVAYVKAKIAEAAASGGVDVDNALSATSTNPVQNKVITSALTGKAGTAVATTSANGLMSKADKIKLDGIAAGATKITIDSAMSDASTNPVQNKVVASALAGKAGTAAATTSTAGLMSAADKAKLDGIAEGANKVTVDTALDASSTNPVQNKAVKAALNSKMDSSPGFIEMNPGSVGHGGYIDFHYNGSTADYTSRIIEDSNGSLNVPNTLKVGGSKVLTEASISSLLLKMYPVGAIYISTVSTSPATLFGGTWTQIKDRFLLAAGSSYTAGATGGEATHKLTVAEMPKHAHSMYSSNSGGSSTWSPGVGSYLVDSVTTVNKTWYAQLGMDTNGSDTAHNNMPPYLAVYVWKRTA